MGARSSGLALGHEVGVVGGEVLQHLPPMLRFLWVAMRLGALDILLDNPLDQ